MCSDSLSFLTCSSVGSCANAHRVAAFREESLSPVTSSRKEITASIFKMRSTVGLKPIIVCYWCNSNPLTPTQTDSSSLACTDFLKISVSSKYNAQQKTQLCSYFSAPSVWYMKWTSFFKAVNLLTYISVLMCYNSTKQLLSLVNKPLTACQ